MGIKHRVGDNQQDAVHYDYSTCELWCCLHLDPDVVTGWGPVGLADRGTEGESGGREVGEGEGSEEGGEEGMEGEGKEEAGGEGGLRPG